MRAAYAAGQAHFFTHGNCRSLRDPGLDFVIGSDWRVAPSDLSREPDLKRFAGLSGRRIEVEALSTERANPPPRAHERRITEQRLLYREYVKPRNVASAIAALKDNLELRLDHVRLSPSSGAHVQFIG